MHGLKYERGSGFSDHLSIPENIILATLSKMHFLLDFNVDEVQNKSTLCHTNVKLSRLYAIRM